MAEGDRHYLRCTGTLKNGRECNVILAAKVAGLLIVKRSGFEMVAEGVRAVRCDRCGTNTTLSEEPIAHPRIEISLPRTDEHITLSFGAAS